MQVRNAIYMFGLVTLNLIVRCGLPQCLCQYYHWGAPKSDIFIFYIVALSIWEWTATYQLFVVLQVRQVYAHRLHGVRHHLIGRLFYCLKYFCKTNQCCLVSLNGNNPNRFIKWVIMLQRPAQLTLNRRQFVCHTTAPPKHAHTQGDHIRLVGSNLPWL